MSNPNPQQCAGAERLIFACSGAADVGAISDRAVRQLTQTGRGKMFCLAGVGGHIQGIVDKTKAATYILAIDGCSLDCAQKTLEQAGCTKFRHLRVTDLGMEKGKAPVTDQAIQTVVSAAETLLA